MPENTLRATNGSSPGGTKLQSQLGGVLGIHSGVRRIRPAGMIRVHPGEGIETWTTCSSNCSGIWLRLLRSVYWWAGCPAVVQRTEELAAIAVGGE